MKINLAIPLVKEQIYILSVSGGIDSMVLLDFLRQKKYCLVVVHFNHLSRLEAIEDKKLVDKYCLTHKIPFHYFELKIPSGNFQNEARILRQQKLKKIALQYKTDFLITAHHLDDLTETILMKIIRGSSLLGYSGMQPSYKKQNFIFLKPFIYIPKTEIIAYAQKNQIPFLEDLSNRSNKYTRNQIRNKVIPSLQKTRSFLQNIKHFHFQMMEVHDVIKNQNRFFLEKYTLKPDLFILKPFLNLFTTFQKNLLLFLLEQKKISKNFILITNIIKGLNNQKKPNIIWVLNQKWLFFKEYKYFGFQLQEQKKNLIQKIQKPLLYICTDQKLLVFCSQKQIIYYNEGSILFPLFLRTRKPGDILKFKFGSQKLKNFFINRKIPLSQRDSIWLLVDQKNVIIYISGFYINQQLGGGKFFYLGLINQKSRNNSFQN